MFSAAAEFAYILIPSLLWQVLGHSEERTRPTAVLTETAHSYAQSEEQKKKGDAL